MTITTCTRCIMNDESDYMITFDENGYCNYCSSALNRLPNTYYPNSEGEQKLKALISKLKQEGIGKEYDCLMGLSGGLDSAYLAYLGAMKWGLRIYAIHVNDGFNTDVAEKNIKDLCEKAKIRLDVITPDSKQFNDLTRSFLFAGVPNIAIPQDNLIFSYLYKIAKKKDLHNFLSGANFALECILEKGNTHSPLDVVNIRDIHRRFGRVKKINLPLMSLFRNKIINKYILKINTYTPLNYVHYVRGKQFKNCTSLVDLLLWSQTLENHLTAFAQLYWFPKSLVLIKGSLIYQA